MRKKAGILFLFKCIKIPLSILLLSLTARYFGVGLGREVWLLAFSTMMAIDTAFWGPVNESFRAKFIFLKEAEGDQKAIEYTQSLLFYILLFSCLAMFFIILLPEFTAAVIAPKYTNEALELLKTMLLFAAPILLFNQAVQIGNSILNAYEVFYVPEISGAINIITNIILLVFLTPYFGIYALLISYFISILINLVFIVFYIKKTNIPLFKFSWNFKFEGFKLYFIYAIPLFFSYFFGQVSAILEKILASTIGIGAVSIIDYSNKIPTMMYVVVINIITTILMPILAKNYAKNNGAHYVLSFQGIYQMGFLLLAFVIVFMMGASEPIIRILYKSKNITVNDLNTIILLSKYYSVCLLGIFLYSIFGMSMIASSKNKQYALIVIITQLIVIFFNLLLIKHLGIFVFPIIFTFAHIIGAFLMYKNFPFAGNDIIKTSIKYFIYTLITTIIMIFTQNIMIFKNIYLNIIYLGFLQIVIMISIMYVMKIEELQLSIIKIKDLLKT